MNLLDDLVQVKKLDKGNTIGSIEAFPEQLRQIWEEISSRKIDRIKKPENIILAGMGGSALGGRIVKDLYLNKLKIPFDIVTEYSLPNFVNASTLLVVSSFSGNTEETLACLQDGLKRKAQILGITTGGQLGKMIKTGKVNGYLFEPQKNPLGYPKTAIGYSLGAILGLLAGMNLIKLSDDEFQESLNEFVEIQRDNFLSSPQRKNPAKQLAQEIQGYTCSFIASEHLKGAAYAARNQVNEISHQNAAFFDIPEMNHHYVEALLKPEAFKRQGAYLFLMSDHYHPRNQKRYQVTKAILKKLTIKSLDYELQSSKKLSQALEVVNLGGFISFYLSILDGEDPGPEPWIIYFKERIKQPTH